MFSKDSKSTSTPASTPSPAPAADTSRAATASRAAAPSIISPYLKIKGDLICNGDIQIDGSALGRVPGAVARGGAVVEHDEVHGAVVEREVQLALVGVVALRLRELHHVVDAERVVVAVRHHDRHRAEGLGGVAEPVVPQHLARAARFRDRLEQIRERCSRPCRQSGAIRHRLERRSIGHPG